MWEEGCTQCREELQRARRGTRNLQRSITNWISPQYPTPHFPWRIILQPHRPLIRKAVYIFHSPLSVHSPCILLDNFFPLGHLPKSVIKLKLQRHCQEDKFLTSSAEKIACVWECQAVISLCFGRLTFNCFLQVLQLQRKTGLHRKLQLISWWRRSRTGTVQIGILLLPSMRSWKAF